MESTVDVYHQDHLINNPSAMYQALLNLEMHEAGQTQSVERNFQEAYREVAPLQKTNLPIYRILQLSKDRIRAFRAGTDLGRSWAFRFKPANIDLFDFFDDEMEDQPWYVIDATVDPAHVDWTRTLYSNCLFPHECEIIMKDHVEAVSFVSIRRLSDDQKRIVGKNLRPDLVGKLFYAKFEHYASHVSG